MASTSSRFIILLASSNAVRKTSCKRRSTPNERQEAESLETAAAFFAGRFAAKEAVVKALGTGFVDDIAWTDVEILRQPTGVPNVHLSGGALAVAQSLGVTRWLVSISHDESHAVASAIALGEA
jgi:holo-[acyl-carrier protein] synthase